jgi:hypothetical protein
MDDGIAAWPMPPACPWHREWSGPLVDPAGMAPEDCNWLNECHREVANRIGPRVDDAVAAWLDAETAPF